MSELHDNLSSVLEEVAKLKHAIQTVTDPARYPRWMRADPDGMKADTARAALRYYRNDLATLADLAGVESPVGHPEHTLEIT